MVLFLLYRGGTTFAEGSWRELESPALGKGQSLKMLFPGGIFDAETTAKEIV